MKISGFSLIRNGIKFDYPYLESIQSMLPLVDELVINIGIGDDETIQTISEFAKTSGQGKVVYFESDWGLDDPEKKRKGLILSEQTNLALARCTFDWCLYLQADEVLHEADIPKLQKALANHHHRPEVEGFVLNYHHFYGSFDVVQVSRSNYRREVRIIRKSSGAQSVGDAQSFRKKDGSKLAVIQTTADVYHYGWVREPSAMREKTFFLDQLYHGAPSPENALSGTPHTGENYRYKKFWGLKPYLGTHPRIMAGRIRSQGWHWDLASSPWTFSWKDIKKVVLDTLEAWTGYRFFEYQSYKIIR